MDDEYNGSSAWFNSLSTGSDVCLSLTSQRNLESKKELEKLKDTINLIDQYDKYLDGLYHEEFNAHKTKLQARIAVIDGPLVITSKESVKQKVKKYLPPFAIYLLKGIIPPKFYK